MAPTPAPDAAPSSASGDAPPTEDDPDAPVTDEPPGAIADRAPPFDGTAADGATAGGKRDASTGAPASEPERVPEGGLSAPDQVLRIAIGDITRHGVDARVGRLVTDALLQEVRKLRKLSAIGYEEVRAMLEFEQEKAAMGCDEDSSCLAEIADALGVDVLVVGGLVRVGDESIFSLRRIDQSSASVTLQVQERLTPAGGEEFLAAIGPAVEKLFPDRALRPGEERGVSPEIARLLNPPPLPLWSLLSAGAVTGGLALGTVILAGAQLVSRALYEGTLADAKEQAVTLDELQSEQLVVNGLFIAALGMGAITLVAGAGTGVLALFTDYVGAEVAE